MVNSALVPLALLALSQAVGAIPTPETAAPSFSFVEWVDSIIANPNGDHLTPEEAVAAFHAAGGSNQTFQYTSRDLLQKRASCYEQPNTEAWLPDAVTCINALASKGGQNCPGYELCTIGGATITSDGNHDSSCNDCARGAGFVLDHCTRSGSNWVEGSEYAYGNGGELIRVRKPPA